MYMRSGASTSVSTQCDLLVLIDFLACGYQNLAQMAITGHLTIRVTDGDTVTVSSRPAGTDNGTSAGGTDCSSLRHSPVDSFMHTSPTPLKSGGHGSSRNRLNISRRCLCTSLHNLRHWIHHDIFCDHFLIRLRIVLVCGQHGHLMMSCHLFLQDLCLCGVPAVIIYILSLCVIIFLIGCLHLSHHRQLWLRHADNNLIAQMQSCVSGKSRVQRQHFIHIIAAAVGDHRKCISRLYLISLILLFFLGHFINSRIQRGQLIRINISFRNLDFFSKIQCLQAITLRNLFLRCHLHCKCV